MTTVQQNEYPPLQGAQLVLLTIAVALATFMETLDLTIVNVSIPAIAGSLGVSPAEGTWAVSSYSLAAAIMQPLSGWIARRFGEVRTFQTSMVLFLICSALCGLANSMTMLIVGRLLQGFVSGPMIAIAQALLLRNFPVEKRGMALGLWGMVVIIAPICGPILGGWITDNLSWPWLFYINLPVGVLSLIITFSILRKRESARTVIPIDVAGLCLLVLGVGSLQYMLDNGNNNDWFGSPRILAAGIVAVVCLTYLIVVELHSKHPILDLHLFRQRNFAVGVLLMSLGYCAYFGISIVFPLWLQTTVGYDATWAGLALAPVGLLAVVTAPIVGRNLHRMNLRLTVSIAFTINCLCIFWASSLNAEATFGQLTLPRLVQGIGMPMFFLPLNQIIMSRMKPHEFASAAGLSNFFRTIAASISTATVIWLWSDRSDFHHAVLVEHVRANAPGWLHTQQVLSNNGIVDAQTHAYAESLVSQQASTLGVNDIYMLVAALFLLLIPLVWLARGPFVAKANSNVH